LRDLESLKKDVENIKMQITSMLFSLNAWWEHHEQLMQWEEETRGEQIPLREEIIQTRVLLRQKMEQELTSAHYGQLSSLIQKRKDTLEEALEDAEKDIADQIQDCYRYQDEMIFFIRLLRKVSRKKPENPLRKVEAEIEATEHFIEELKRSKAQKHKELQIKKHQTEEALFFFQSKSFHQRYEKAQELQLGAFQLWKFFEESHKLLIGGQSLLDNQPEGTDKSLLESALEELTRVKDNVLERLKQSDEFTQKEFVASFHGHCSALSARIEEVPLNRAISLLTNARQQIQDIEPLIPEEAPKEVKKHQKRYRKYFRNEEMEKKLQHRMENIFGYRAVHFLENFILFLIFAVIGLLVVETVWAKEVKPYENILWWTDIIICFLFLFEFFLKMGLSSAKFLYFKNHFWFDFVPSIPFGLLQLAQADVARAGRVARVARLTRILRYIRAARPIIRMMRVFFLMFRVMDRLVKKYAGLLNRNIILFTQEQSINMKLELSLEDEVFHLNHRLNRRIKNSLQALPAEQAGEVVSQRLEKLYFLLEKTEFGKNNLYFSEKKLVDTTQPSVREIPIEQVIAQLLFLDEVKMRRFIEVKTAENLVRYLKLFDLPLIRSLPVLRDVIPYIKEESALSVTARAGRSLGRGLERLVSIFHYFADFHGIVSAPQLLDRVGRTMVNATKRPATRLVMFGAIFFLIQILVYFSGLTFLEPATQWLSKNLGLPIVILGVLCALPLAAGLWLTHIAGQASAFYERVSEAQYINLLKEVKHHNCSKDINFLYPRTLFGEYSQEEAPFTIDDFVKRLQLTSNLHFEEDDKETLPTWLEGHLVSLLYRDYLDGAILHNTDTKTSEQLLGNLTIDSIKRQKLKYTKREIKHLDKLNLADGKGVLTPYIWFSFITQSLTQKTARMVVDYNRHCFPLEDYAVVGKAEQEAMQQWMEQKKSNKVSSKEQQEQELLAAAEGVYRTTEFTALHFLSGNPHRDKYIQARFGDEVLEVLRKDRRNMIRSVFGSYPLHELSRNDRTINPYEFYEHYCSSGKIFLMPFFAMGLLFKLLGASIRFTMKSIRDILNPSLAPNAQHDHQVDFTIAARNINRMRKPVFLEALRMRAFFDHEFLGLATPGSPNTLPSDVMDDLEFIGGSTDDLRFYSQLIEKKSSQLIKFRQFLQDEGLHEEGFIGLLEELCNGNNLAQNQYRIMRALTLAYLLNYKEMATGYEAHVTLESELEGLLADEEALSKLKPAKPVFIGKAKQALFEEYWKISKFKDRQAGEMYQCMRYCLKKMSLTPLLHSAIQLGEKSNVHSIVNEVIRHWHMWNQELVSLRTVQSLAVMDVINYRHIVYQLGDYGEQAKGAIYLTSPKARPIFTQDPKQSTS